MQIEYITIFGRWEKKIVKPEIEIEEVVKENIAEFWDLHWEYLNRDVFPYETLCTPSDEEDREYFHGREYRGVMES